MAPYQTLVEKYTGLPINALVSGVSNFFGRSAGAKPVPSVRPVMSDELPRGAYMNEKGEVFGVMSDQVPKGGYMTELGHVYVPTQGKPKFSTAPAPVVTGTKDGVTPDRRQSDLYKQYAQTPEGQFQRYFQSPEMNQYFGALASAGAPQNVQAMADLASQQQAPTTTPLATYYRAQSAAGRGNMPEVVSGLTQGLGGKEAENMAAWAKANPMLAFREYNKRFPAGAPTTGPSFANPQASPELKGVTAFAPGAAPGETQGFDSTSAFINPPGPFSLQGGAMTQGRAVSAPFDEAQLQAAWKTNPQNFTSQLPGISERVSNFVGTFKR